MARQYSLLKRVPTALQVRFEDMHDRFNATAEGIVRRLYRGHSPRALVDRVNREQCDPGTWTPEQVASSSHVTATKAGDGGRPDKEDLARWLLADDEVKGHLCWLAEVLEYEDARCKGWHQHQQQGGGTRAGSGSASSGGGERAAAANEEEKRKRRAAQAAKAAAAARRLRPN